jgi:hypothetical protein
MDGLKLPPMTYVEIRDWYAERYHVLPCVVDLLPQEEIEVAIELASLKQKYGKA